jgi:2-oxoglutarate dehydrogenase E1 component
MLLPHGYEGQGPEHSSARLERFLQNAAEDNVQVCNLTTPAQLFHALRRQVLRPWRKPLVLMTPKSLLRHPLASSRASDLTQGHFRPVLDDPRAAERPDRIERVVLCSGHIWAELESDARRAEDEHVAVVRLEQLYPFPKAELRATLERYAAARDVIWLQEEPENMGAWMFVAPHLQALVGDRGLRYVGRPRRASPAEGWSEAHVAEQHRILSEILQAHEVAAHAR